MSGQPDSVGDLIDSLGVMATVGEGELVSSAIVLMAVVDEDGKERISIAWSEGLSWITRTGILHHALAEETKGDIA